MISGIAPFGEYLVVLAFLEEPEEASESEPESTTSNGTSSKMVRYAISPSINH
jgi:hypothetical protein